MTQRTVTLRATDPGARDVVEAAGLAERFEAIRAEQEVPREFPAEVIAEAERVAAEPLVLPERDEIGVPFVTIDPPGSMDLDQALHIERAEKGYRVRYAIAHLVSFVEPGGAIDTEARKRGQTIYAPDRRIPLHPPVLSEGRASLLPDQLTPAYVWDLHLADDGDCYDIDLYPAMVKSVARLDYQQVQDAIDDGSADEVLMLLKEVGELRVRLEQERGGATLPMPEQEVDDLGDGRYRLHLRPMLPVEEWNAQISLMTGMAAAQLMLHARVGLLRTLPEASAKTLAQLRRIAHALGVDWAAEQTHGEFLRSLDRANPTHLALIHEATALFRGAGYTAFDGELPELVEHSGLAAAYAHVTAPLRRLVDRFGLALCAAICADEPVPTWVREALPQLPEIMAASDRVSGAVARASTDAVEAATLADRVGETFDAFVVDAPEGNGSVTVQLLDPPVIARATGSPELGREVTVRLDAVDLAKGTVSLAVV